MTRDLFLFLCRLGRRVDRMEKSIGSIVTKIDAVLAKLETMERGRNKRKATMSKILGTITESDGRKYTLVQKYWTEKEEIINLPFVTCHYVMKFHLLDHLKASYLIRISEVDFTFTEFGPLGNMQNLV